MSEKRVLLWLGSGFSAGSQPPGPNQPPLGQTFFTHSGVVRGLRQYPVLTSVWRQFGEQQSLEEFWVQLDRPGGKLETGPVLRALRRSIREPAHEGLRDYYLHHSEEPVSASVGRAVAGFELKCLFFDRLACRRIDRDQLFPLWTDLQVPVRVLTFNYDLFVERSIQRQFSYELTLDPGIADILKLHGSIQWRHRKFCDREGSCRFAWADDGESSINIRADLKCSPPRSWFGRDCHEKPCLHLDDPLVIGLREKREFREGHSPEENRLILNLFSDLLRSAQEALSEAHVILVIGFSFSAADYYLWKHLTWRTVGSPRKLVVCYMDDGENGMPEYEKRVQEFFGTDGQFFSGGFGPQFLRWVSRITRRCRRWGAS